ncbi:MAG: hypothetical protein BTN85_0816 [Candidatus Methanohalarchaeum thermophilum]|uniref:Uncharacterized protein n=1 Tax=Methanohalarchaeum thermophilum TaxID=1903181 RepID=A0A1Q6DVF7_METT1|nr:MAG: hypothetical protein BTN85_0816 [Candidatus Methanohalarchaeum thermophilum]
MSIELKQFSKVLKLRCRRCGHTVTKEFFRQEDKFPFKVTNLPTKEDIEEGCYYSLQQLRCKKCQENIENKEYAEWVVEEVLNSVEHNK